MIELIGSIAAMYLVVGAAGFWMIRRQRMLRATEIDEATDGGRPHG